jgi:hypothetical protein
MPRGRTTQGALPKGPWRAQACALAVVQMPIGYFTSKCLPLSSQPAPGPAGASVREIMRRTGADIKSWTEAHSSTRTRRPARIFLIGVRARRAQRGWQPRVGIRRGQLHHSAYVPVERAGRLPNKGVHVKDCVHKCKPTQNARALPHNGPSTRPAVAAHAPIARPQSLWRLPICAVKCLSEPLQRHWKA